MTLKKIMLIIHGISMMTLTVPCWAVTYSDEHMKAAIGAQIYQEQVVQAAQDCASQFASQGGEYFLFMNHLWPTGNVPISLASGEVIGASSSPPSRAEAVRQKFAVSFMTSFREASTRRKYELCEMLASQGKKLNFENAYPLEANLLLEVFNANPAWKIVKRNADFTNGCMKKQWNSGRRDVERVKGACECQTAVLVQSASDQQLEDWLNQMQANPGNYAAVVEGIPWLKAALPAINACLSK